jgi:hypothetical protein
VEKITPPSGVAADFPLGGVMWWYTVLLGNHHTASVSRSRAAVGASSLPRVVGRNMLIERALVES